MPEKLFVPLKNFKVPLSFRKGNGKILGKILGKSSNFWLVETPDEDRIKLFPFFFYNRSTQSFFLHFHDAGFINSRNLKVFSVCYDLKIVPFVAFTPK